MKKLKSLFVVIAVTGIVMPFSPYGCSETTRVEEKVEIEPGNGSTTVIPQEKDVDVDVHVEGNSAPQPVIVEEKRVEVHIERDKPVNITPVIPEEKKVEVNTNINVIPPNSQTDTVTTNSSTTVETDSTF